ncbi:hypothetical protein HanPSC8_Chr01g0023491 [Helianthus annuus]|nr:hypothetical protein HanPSC8_Chr01g0023491 [Helianthus annuus]
MVMQWNHPEQTSPNSVHVFCCLENDTCNKTDNASNTMTPDEISNGKNIPVEAAIAARAPPNAKVPVSPINTEALYRLWKRKPTQAPAIDAPNTARSGFNSKKKLLNKSAIFFFSKIDLIRVWLLVSGYRPEHIGRTAMDIPMNASAAVPPANPSRPSVNSIPFAIETKQNEVNNT